MISPVSRLTIPFIGMIIPDNSLIAARLRNLNLPLRLSVEAVLLIIRLSGLLERDSGNITPPFGLVVPPLGQFGPRVDVKVRLPLPYSPQRGQRVAFLRARAPRGGRIGPLRR